MKFLILYVQMDSYSEKYQLHKLAYGQSRITNHCTVICNVTYQTKKHESFDSLTFTEFTANFYVHWGG
jgi:hypothetical protein